MKKTLITLAALAMASVASAESQIITGSIPGSGTYGIAGDFKISFTLTDASALEDGDILMGYWGWNPPGGANVYAFTKSGNALNLTLGAGVLTGSHEDLTTAAYTHTTSATLDYDFSKASSATVYTLDVTNNNGTHTVKLWEGYVLKDTVSYNATFGDPYYNDINARFNDSIATVTAEPAGGVPEPTTATLSLLALAGLAARRRRK